MAEQNHQPQVTVDPLLLLGAKEVELCSLRIENQRLKLELEALKRKQETVVEAI